MRLPAAVAALSLLGAGLLTGCGLDAGDLPLPGVTVPGESFLLDAEFDDTLNLATGAKVKVNGIDVGKVKEVKADGFHAIAVLRVQENAAIRRGATARLRYNTPLGELFVDIRSPEQGTLLGAGDTMVPPETSTAPTVEDALASASLLINGGGLEQLQTITREFQTAVRKRGPTIRQLLDRTTDFLVEANATTADIDRALTALAGASKALNARRDIVNRAVREITPAAKALRENTDEVVVLLQELVKLGKQANTLVGASRADLLRTIRELGPVLAAFYSLRGQFGSGLRALQKAGNALGTVISGDWLPAIVSADLGQSVLGPTDSGGGGAGGGGGVQLPGLPPIQLPTIPGLPPIALPPIGILGRAPADTGATSGVGR